MVGVLSFAQTILENVSGRQVSPGRIPDGALTRGFKAAILLILWALTVMSPALLMADEAVGTGVITATKLNMRRDPDHGLP